MTAPAPTDLAAARERFYRAAFLWCADQSCSNALADLEDAYEALQAILVARVNARTTQPQEPRHG